MTVATSILVVCSVTAEALCQSDHVTQKVYTLQYIYNCKVNGVINDLSSMILDRRKIVTVNHNVMSRLLIVIDPVVAKILSSDGSLNRSFSPIYRKYV